jgi:twitching motility protein PilT
MTPQDIYNMFDAVAGSDLSAEYRTKLELDFSFQTADKLRLRINAFHTVNGPAMVIRLIPAQKKTLDELQVPQVVKKLAGLDKGIVLITGPTGSGKTTTLAGILDHINNNYSKHILTIEDPVEFLHKPVQSLISQREVGESTLSFAAALKSALREDPDIIMVGEMRDIETTRLALTAAETGHLVISTLHTSSAPQTIDRVIEIFPGEEKEMIRTVFANSLEAVISQRLVKRRDGAGRIAVYEILLATKAVRNLIRENKIPQIFSVMQVNAAVGMQTMEDHLGKLVADGIISKEVADETLNKGGEDVDSNAHNSYNVNLSNVNKQVKKIESF